MKIIEVTGKTIDEAIEQGLKELNCTKDEVKIEIIEAPSKGFLGFIGVKAAKIKLSFREKIDEAEVVNLVKKQVFPSDKKNQVVNEEVSEITIGNQEQPEKIAVDFLSKIFEKLEVKVNVEVTKQDHFICLTFRGEDLGILIGRRGETLDSLQYLTNLVVGRNFGQKFRFILDVEGYRKRREQTLVNLAYRLSEKVKKTGHNIVLEPMNPHERRIIHTALQNDQKVRTFSEGEEPYRKVIITRKSR